MISSSISVTSAAIGDRSRIRVMWANSGWRGFLDDGGDPVVATHPQVVSLGDIMGKHHPRSRAEPGQHSQQDVALQRLRLVDDHEGVVQRPAADVGERQHLQHAAGLHFLQNCGAREAFEGVSKTACAQGPILSLSLPGR